MTTPMDGGHDMHSMDHTMNTEHMHPTHDPGHGDSGSHMMQVSHRRVDSVEGGGVGGRGLLWMEDITCTVCITL